MDRKKTGRILIEELKSYVLEKDTENMDLVAYLMINSWVVDYSGILNNDQILSWEYLPLVDYCNWIIYHKWLIWFYLHNPTLRWFSNNPFSSFIHNSHTIPFSSSNSIFTNPPFLLLPKSTTFHSVFSPPVLQIAASPTALR